MSHLECYSGFGSLDAKGEYLEEDTGLQNILKNAQIDEVYCAGKGK